MTRSHTPPALSPRAAPYEPGLLSWLTIVPEAHVRVLDRALQLEMYAVFHVHRVCRLGHLLGTPVVLLSTMALAQSQLGAWGLGLSLALAATQVANALRLDRGVAAVVSLEMLALLAVSLPLSASALGAGVWLAVMLGGALLQSASHAIELVPPPWSDHPGWERLGVLWRRHGFSRIPGYVVLFSTSVLLEWWASYRIAAYQVMQLMLEAGYRPGLARALAERQATIRQDHRSGWGASADAAQRVSL